MIVVMSRTTGKQAQPQMTSTVPKPTFILTGWRELRERLSGSTAEQLSALFFHRLAWTSNYGLISKIFGPIVAYFLLTAEGFGAANLTSTIIILVSLQDLSNLSTKLLDYLVSMARGCSTLLDVAEILNADVEYKEASDIEDGGGKKDGKDL
mmetsp:Transcript_8390/g.17589  ORF Transcript_8390/g.17589 Transcript_8390/m.17589 type:complete len:152 (-) Transcript_8390:170-625(-)